MNRQEAAKHLGISVRSLQRYVKAGHLPVRYEAGKTRPVPVFEKAAVESLRVTLCARPLYPQSQVKSEQECKQPFGVRLSQPVREELVRNAQRFNMRPSELTRHLIEAGLQEGLQNQVSALLKEVKVLRAQVHTLEAALRQVQKDLPDAIEVVMEYAGMSHAEARRWTNANLRVGLTAPAQKTQRKEKQP